MVIRSLCYGYLGAILAGLVIGVAAGLPQDTIVTAAPPVGIVMGLTGLSLPWLRPALTRARRR